MSVFKTHFVSINKIRQSPLGLSLIFQSHCGGYRQFVMPTFLLGAQVRVVWQLFHVNQFISPTGRWQHNVFVSLREGLTRAHPALGPAAG